MESAKLKTTTNKIRRTRAGLLCIVPDCLSANYPGCGIRFHLFPKEAEKRKRWLTRLNLSPDDYHEKAVVCYLHFHVSDYCNNNPKNKLKPFALPHVNKNQPSSDSGESDFESIDVEEALERLNKDSSASENDSNDDDINKYFTSASSGEELVEEKEVKKNEQTVSFKPKVSKKKVENEISKVKKEKIEESEEIFYKIEDGKHNINEDPDTKLVIENVLTHVCRICLTTDFKMYPMKQHDLEQKYLQLTGITLDMSDESKMPRMLCFECLKRLRNFVEFSTKSLTSWSLLMELSEENKLTMDGIRSINRQQNSLTSNLAFTIYEPNYFDIQIEECYEYDDKNIINEDHIDHINNADIKMAEHESFEIKKELKLERIHSIEDIHKENTVVDQLSGSRYTIKNGNIAEIDESTGNVNPSKKINTSKNLLHNENRNLNTNGLSSDNVNGNENVCPSENEQPSDGDGISQPKGRKTNERYNKEFNEMFTVKIMTLEDQIADIESRKNSLNYQNAVFKCYKCFRGFNFEGPFNDHMKRHTNECGEFVCNVCHMHYKSRFSLTSHFRSNHKTFIECRLCPFKTTWKPGAADHKSYHDENRYQCSTCNMTFAKIVSLNTHMQRSHPEDAICHLCGKSYVGLLSLAKHRRAVHQGEDLQLPETCPCCPICNMRFRDEAAIRIHFAVSPGHWKSAKKPNIPPELPQTEVEKNLSPKNEPESGPVTCEQLLANAPYCPTCDIHFLDEAALRLHLTVSPNHGYPPVTPNESPSRPLPGDRLETYQRNELVSDPATCEQLVGNAPYCPKCDIRFRNEATLCVHLAVAPNHGEPPKTPCESPKPPPPKRKVYRRNRPSAGPVTCEQCDLFCPTLRTYMKHFGDAHPTHNRTQFSPVLPTYMCELCGKIFQNITILNEHRVSHSGLRPHACDKCPSTFKTKHDLRIHHANHTKSRRCSLCGNVYATIGGLMRHIMCIHQIHTGKPYSCEPCNKRFCTPSAKRAHYRHTHLGEPWPKKRSKGQFEPRYRGGKFQSEADMETEMQTEYQGEDQNVLTQYIDEE